MPKFRASRGFARGAESSLKYFKITPKWHNGLYFQLKRFALKFKSCFSIQTRLNPKDFTTMTQLSLGESKAMLFRYKRIFGINFENYQMEWWGKAAPNKLQLSNYDWFKTFKSQDKPTDLQLRLLQVNGSIHSNWKQKSDLKI